VKKYPWFFPLFWGAIVITSSVALWVWSYALPHGKNVCNSATCVARTPFAPALLSAAGVFWVGVGVVLLVRRTEGIDRARRPVVDQSMTTAVLALGITLAALGGAVGRWLTLIGAALALAGIGGLVRERRALRSLRREEERRP
jgi:hypothetical protein